MRIAKNARYVDTLYVWAKIKLFTKSIKIIYENLNFDWRNMRPNLLQLGKAHGYLSYIIPTCSFSVYHRSDAFSREFKLTTMEFRKFTEFILFYAEKHNIYNEIHNFKKFWATQWAFISDSRCIYCKINMTLDIISRFPFYCVAIILREIIKVRCCHPV